MRRRYNTLSSIRFRQVRNLDTWCLEWSRSVIDGYGVVRYGGKQWRVHRLMWTKYRGSIPRDLKVCHHCDNRICGELSHLFLGTDLDNKIDSVRKGRHAFGDRVGNSFFTNKEANRIRAIYARTSLSTYDLSELFGCSAVPIKNIVRNKS